MDDARPAFGHRLRRRSVMGAVALGVAMTGLVAEAPAAQAAPAPCTVRAYPARLCKVGLSSSLVRAGSPVVVSGIGFQARSLVTVYFRSRQLRLGTVRASRTGQVYAVIRIPKSTAAGLHQIVLMGKARNGRSVRTLASTIRVVRHRGRAVFPGSVGAGVLGGVAGGVVSGGVSGAGETGAGGTAGGATAEENEGGLAATGAALAVPAGALGGILLLAGGVFLVAGRRRRHGTDAGQRR